MMMNHAIHFIIIYVMSFCIGEALQHSISTLMYNFLFGIHYIYINDFSIFMCQCVYMMLLLLHMFKILKKNIYFVVFNVCRGFPFFCQHLPKRFFPDPRRLFVDADFFNIVQNHA
jgi:hypothetical protein